MFALKHTLRQVIVTGRGVNRKHNSPKSCDLRFGSKRTEKLKSHEAQPSVISIFPCALKAKSQITTLWRVMFAINTTTGDDDLPQSVL